MITDCAGLQQWDLVDTETIFAHGVFALLKILIPVVLWVYSRNARRTERGHQRRSVLGLEDGSGGGAERSAGVVLWPRRALLYLNSMSPQLKSATNAPVTK